MSKNTIIKVLLCGVIATTTFSPISAYASANNTLTQDVIQQENPIQESPIQEDSASSWYNDLEEYKEFTKGKNYIDSTTQTKYIRVEYVYEDDCKEENLLQTRQVKESNDDKKIVSANYVELSKEDFYNEQLIQPRASWSDSYNYGYMTQSLSVNRYIINGVTKYDVSAAFAWTKSPGATSPGWVGNDFYAALFDNTAFSLYTKPQFIWNTTRYRNGVPYTYTSGSQPVQTEPGGVGVETNIDNWGAGSQHRGLLYFSLRSKNNSSNGNIMTQYADQVTGKYGASVSFSIPAGMGISINHPQFFNIVKPNLSVFVDL